MREWFRSLLTACFLITLFAIIQDRDRGNVWKGSIEIKDGVTIVKNPSTPLFRESILELQDEFVIKESAAPADYMFVSPSMLSLDAKKNLYVCDSRDSNIKVFDEHGRFVRIIGKQGIGPGELDGPSGMDIFHNEIAVNCSRNRRLIFFDLEGKYQRTLYARATFGRMAFDSKGNVYAIPYVNRDGHVKYELQKFDSSLKYIKTLASRDWTEPVLFTATANFAVTREDLIVYGNPEKYEIKIFNGDGKLVKLIQKDHVSVRIPPEEIELVSKKSYIFANKRMPEYYAPYYDIQIDDEERIIVRTRYKLAGNKESTYDVFGPEGKFLATMNLKYFYECLWANHRLYTVEEDKEGLPIVKAYRVVWKYDNTDF